MSDDSDAPYAEVVSSDDEENKYYKKSYKFDEGEKREPVHRKRRKKHTCSDFCYYVCATYCCLNAFLLVIIFIMWIFNYAATVRAVTLVPY